MTTWTLSGSGRLPMTSWPELAGALSGWSAGWADLDGFHLALPPGEPPPGATHLWAWKRGRWLRVRLDGDSWTAALLVHGTGPAGLFARHESDETIAEVSCTRIISWREQDDRVRQRVVRGGVPAEMWQLVPVRGDTAVFVGTTDTLDA